MIDELRVLWEEEAGRGDPASWNNTVLDFDEILPRLGDVASRRSSSWTITGATTVSTTTPVPST